ncbi:MAG: type II toxin-antitoxin system PemK/MazF family toxin [Acidobacteriota bacterium]|jgi:mRNA interferase MazF|nr:type II toxin-antitoxin system PemK/MazF family toxin [Acidobacteriota bacterium]MDQ3489522.1 type II toxin-antitoxin system PemK/MazF family toxin [Acidobacteriota bacterium]
MVVERFAVYLVNLDAHPSKDAKNTRPGVVISPNELNRNLENVIIAPLSSTKLNYPTRVPVDFLNDNRFVILDQIRAVDKLRLVKKIGEIEESSQAALIERLLEMFAK